MSLQEISTRTLEAPDRQSVIGYRNQTTQVYNALKHLACYDACTWRISFS